MKKSAIPANPAAGGLLVAVAPVNVDANSGTKLSAARARGLAETIRQKMEQRLAGVPDIRVAERTRLDTVLREKGLAASNSNSDAGKLAEAAKALGASKLVAPTIVDLDSKSQKFTGYGVSTSRISATASILVRVIDVPTSTVKYSATFEGRALKESSTFSPEGGEDVESEAVRDALNRALADQALIKAVKN